MVFASHLGGGGGSNTMLQKPGYAQTVVGL